MSNEKLTAIVNFRTLAKGSYRWMRGLTRGYYRILLVRDLNGSTHANSRNVVEIVREGRSGLLGVTERSGYWLGFSRTTLEREAAEINRIRAVAESHFAL